MTPIEDRRVSGPHWWDKDRLKHLKDLPKYCPRCGENLGNGITVEFWEAEDRVYHIWCRSCEWAGDIIRVTRMIAYEADD